MTREERSVSLAILTLIVYSVFMLLEKGALLFPYPLNEIIFLIISIQFLWWNREKPSDLIILPALGALINLFSTQFFWSLRFDSVQMEQLTSGPLLDIAKLIYYLILAGWAVRTVRKFPNASFLHYFLAAILFLLPAFFPYPLIEFFPLLVMAFFAIRYKNQNTNHLLWILLAALQLMKVAMIYLS
jgi:hypothetical protein